MRDHSKRQINVNVVSGIGIDDVNLYETEIKPRVIVNKEWDWETRYSVKTNTRPSQEIVLSEKLARDLEDGIKRFIE